MPDTLLSQDARSSTYDTGQVDADGRRLFRLESSAGPVRFLNDLGAWESIVHGSNDRIAGNCEFVPIVGGYRLWKPNYASLKIGDPAWTDEDFWLEVTDANGVATFTVLRTVVTEQAVLAGAGSAVPAYTWRCSANLTPRRAANIVDWEWVDSYGNVVFTKRGPKAWSQGDRSLTVAGIATLNPDGSVGIVWDDLSGLAYPIVMDPTSTFNPSSGDGECSGAPEGVWATARNASASQGTNTTSGQVLTWWNGSFYRIYRVMMPFDTSSLGAGATVQSATFRAYVDFKDPDDVTSIDIVQSAQASATALATTDFPLAGYTSGGNKTLSSMVLNANSTWTLNATGLTWISTTAISKLALITNLDQSNTAPTTNASFGGINVQTSEGANPPLLSVIYYISISGPNNPSTIISDTGIGTEWTTPGNAAASDNAYASAVLPVAESSNYLKSTGYGFSIPGGATIDGILVEIERKSSASGCQDASVKIVKGGTISGTEQAAITFWPTTDTYKSYGSASDLWGLTWAASDINASNFGVALKATNADELNSRTATVDHMRITVYYTEAAPTKASGRGMRFGIM